MADTKQYLISFMAEVHGDQVVVKSMQNIEKQINKTTKSTKDFGAGISKALALAGRSFFIIPIWFAMRQAFMGLVSSIQDSLQFLVDWEYELAQIRIVGESTETEIQNISNAMLMLARSLGISHKSLSEGCFDKETEILTDSGWKYFKDLTYSDKVLSMNPQDRELDYYKIKNIISYNYTGDLYTYKDSIDFKVTPNHRFLYRLYGGNRDKYKKNEIQNITNEKIYIPTSGNWLKTTKKAYFEFFETTSKNKLKIDTKTFFEFLGWFISEGCVIKDKNRKDSYRIKISQKKKNYLSEIENILKRMGLSGYYNTSEYAFKFANKVLGKYLLEQCGHTAKNKKIPIELKNYNKEYLIILLHNLVKGDGSIIKKRNSFHYTTVSKQLADDIQEIAVKCGYAVSISKQKTDHQLQYRLYIATKSKNKNIKINKIVKEYYNDKVYCVEVEPYNTIFVRRNGKSYWTLNSILWIQQGRSIAETIPLLEATAKLSMLTGRSMSQSVEDLTAVMKAYNFETDKSTHIIDSVTNVQLKHAITTDVLVGAFRTVASTASQMNISFEKLQGIITATHAVTRTSGEAVGRAWRTIFSRMATDASKSIAEIAKVPVFLTATGESSLTVTNNMRNLGDVLTDIALRWQDLTSAQQLSLAESLAGKRQLNELIAFMNNYKESVQAQADAMFSSGKSMNAVDTISKTLKNRIEGLSQSFHTLVNAILGTEVMKKGVTGFSSILDALTLATNASVASYNKTVGSLKTLEIETDKQMTLNEGLLNTWVEMQRVNAIFKENPELAKQWSKYLGDVYTQSIKLAGIEVPDWVVDSQTLFKWLNDNLSEIQNKISQAFVEKRELTLKKELAGVASNIQDLIVRTKEFSQLRTGSIVQWAEFFKDLQNLTISPEKFDKLSQALENIDTPQSKEIQSFIDTYIKKQAELANVSKTRTDAELQAQKKINDLTKEHTTNILTAEQARQALTNIELKALETGQNDLEIKKLQLKYLQKQSIQEDDSLEKQEENLRLSIAKSEAEERRSRTLQAEDILLAKMKLYGATDLQIEIQRLVLMKSRGDALSKIQDQEDSIAKMRISVLSEEKKRLTDIFMQYEQADALQKARIRRFIELSQMSAETIAQRFKNDMFDKNIIQEYWSSFSESARQAIGEVLRQQFNLPQAKIPGETGMTISKDIANKAIGTKIQGTQDISVSKPNVPVSIDMQTHIGSIIVKLPDDSLDKLAENAGKKFMTVLKTNEELRKKLADLLRIEL